MDIAQDTETPQVSQEQPVPKPQKDNSMKNIGVLVSFAVILMVVTAVIVARFTATHQQQTETQAMTHPPRMNVATGNTITPTPNASNAQIDQDIQNAQNSLNDVDTNINTANQAVTNQSADTPQ